ncbi:hypothetical protein B5M43_013525 [Microbacterium sp. MEC084]|uniref:hypothetical protein n=1 Tax=Microbacterium sp. MEC084 TaxID=1963027 RepID=UPI00106FE69E|nr:hypothetical protein [Microbacterium sp. MEC084]MCD1269844.1 hypothetical protein [Microbacterium sp. MEC084]
MSDSSEERSAEDRQTEGEGLVSQVRIIEGQPLADRAAAYASLHDELARRLEQAPAEPGE